MSKISLAIRVDRIVAADALGKGVPEDEEEDEEEQGEVEEQDEESDDEGEGYSE